MSSAHEVLQPISNSRNTPAISAHPQVTSREVPSMIAPGYQTRSFSAGASDRTQPTSAQLDYNKHLGEAVNAAAAAHYYPLENSGMVGQWRNNASPTAGATAHVSPSPAKRAFNLSYVNSNPMTISDADLTQSPKRRGDPVRSARRKTMAETINEAAFTSPIRQRVEKIATTERGGQSNTSSGIEGQNAGDSLAKVVQQGQLQDYNKYYQYLAQKNGMHLKRIPSEDDTLSAAYVKPYTPIYTSAVKEGDQENPLVAGAVSSLRASGKAYTPQPIDAPIRQPYGYQGSSRQLTDPQSQIYYGLTHGWLRQMPQGEHKYQLQPNDLQNKGQRSVYTPNLMDAGSIVPRSSISTFIPNQQTAQFQPVQGSMQPNQQLKTLLEKNSNFRHPNLEMSRRMADYRAQISGLPPAPSFSTAPLGSPTGHNHSDPTNSMQGPPDTRMYQQFPVNSLADISTRLRPAQSYHPEHGGANTGASFSNQFSSLLSAQYPKDGRLSTNFDVNPSKISVVRGVVIEANSKAHDMFEADVEIGNFARTNLPEWMALNTQAQVRIFSGDTSPEEDTLHSAYPEPPTSTTESALATCPLPNINQAYTGTPAIYRPFDASQHPDGPIYLPPLPLHIPLKKNKKARASRKAPVFFIGKAPTPRKSRAKKITQSISNSNFPSQDFAPENATTQSDLQTFIFQPTAPRNAVRKPHEQTAVSYPSTAREATPESSGQVSTPQPITPHKAIPESKDNPFSPQPVTPRTATPRPPMFDFSSPSRHPASTGSSTVSRMMAGNYAELFRRPEDETRWKQDAYAQTMAELGTPSKYQLKKEEAERKRLQKEMEKAKK
ncbi:uncharacterized protein RSE6_00740 [Rhynchosporium secalis]|uniref:Uncharacterized protein n=1 Tax=Rhynchosporium secalis TaxID=38038 RepID=A0A1E1LW05_RHYSE|nr:uncharacterized protein RSE6_00740 [Rhynchosporium secalis]